MSKIFRLVLFVALWLLISLCGAGFASAAGNNPLNTIRADSFSKKSKDIKMEPCAQGGRSLASIHEGDFVMYKDFDFDSGVAAVNFRIAGFRKGRIDVHLDSKIGPLMGTCSFLPTDGWQTWANARCNVDSALSGVHNIYLVFHGQGTGRGAIVNLSQFVFLKSTVIPGQGINLSGRLDVVDNEPQAGKAWGIPERGFTDDFAHGTMSRWRVYGLTITKHAISGAYSVAHRGSNPGFAFTPGIYINKTDVGGKWRTLAEASLAVDIVADSKNARPGIGFASNNGKQWVYVILNFSDDEIEAHRKLADGSDVVIHAHPRFLNDMRARHPDWKVPTATLNLRPGLKYRLQVDWSPFSDGMIVFLRDGTGHIIATFRTVIDLPAARRPMLICSGGRARFDNVKFNPKLDGWDYQWQWYKQPVLGDDVCNPAVWKGKDGGMYMVWRKFGADTFHGIASSADGIHWSRVNDKILKCTGDMNVLIDPFGNGLTYLTPGGGNMPWFTSDGSNHYTVWKTAPIKVGNIFGNCRIQALIDTAKHAHMSPIEYRGAKYRYIAYVEDWNRMPKPHSVVLLSNTLHKWVLPYAKPVIPPANNFWGEKGNAIGAAFPLPDGNILIADCACTWAGYSGTPEPTNVFAIADGKTPWKILKLSVLPDTPVSREPVWYQGPNFGTDFYYDKATDTLFFYGGFHDYRIGVMRVRHFVQTYFRRATVAAK